MSPAIGWLFELAGRGASELILVSWQAMILVSSVWLGLKLVRVKSPALRHQIWLLTLVALALLPLAGAFARRFPMIQASPITLTYVIEAPRIVMSQRDPVAGRESSGALALKDSAKISLPSTASFLTGSLLFAAWLMGAFAPVMRLVLEQKVLRRRCRRAKIITMEELGVFESEALSQRRIGLRLSNEIDSPLLCGIFRPVILLPENLAEWTTPDERKAILEHEIAHVARRDPHANFFQTVMRVIFFFHPLVRYACRQLNVERELACDARVMELGTRAEVYAESLLKVAERSLMPKLRYQLAFLSAKQILERRVEMIVNGESVRTIARHWKATVCSAALIAIFAWLLIPGSANPGIAQTAKRRTEKIRVEALGEQKNFEQLIDFALRNPFPDLRQLAAVRLTELEGDGSTAAMVHLYNQTNEATVKKLIIDALARISEIGPLTDIALSDQNLEYRERALRRIKYLKTHSESADVKNWDVPGLADRLNQTPDEALPPPPPKPPGAERWLPLPPPPPRRR